MCCRDWIAARSARLPNLLPPAGPRLTDNSHLGSPYAYGRVPSNEQFRPPGTPISPGRPMERGGRNNASAYTGGMAQQNADQSVHEAARAGLTDELAEMLARDASLIDARGIDAHTPLH